MFPPSLCQDRLIRDVQSELDAAVQGWQNGLVLEEVALLNRITERLRRRRPKCDVGLLGPVAIHPTVEIWHRQDSGSDRFGCDLALTFESAEDGFIKSACIQLKRCDKGRVTVDPQQVANALADPRIASRAFTLAIDKERGFARVTRTAELVGHKRVDCTQWLPLSEWLVQWMSCSIGEKSNYDERRFEACMLSAFRQSTVPAERFDLPDGVAPARVRAELVVREGRA